MPNYLGKPNWPDYRILGNYFRGKSAPSEIHSILRKYYERYWAVCRAPFDAAIFAIGLPLVTRDKLKARYTSGSPLSKLVKERLTKLQGLSACPYCGLQKNVTVDHYLPKEHFPQYAFFSLNLVPSCSDCQSPAAKGQWFPGYQKGGNPKRQPSGRNPLDRILHPYFDFFLRERNFYIVFKPLEYIDDIDFVILAKNRSHHRLIKFHAEKIKLKKVALPTVKAFWEALILDVRKNPINAVDEFTLKRYLSIEAGKVFDKCRSLNNMEYLFYHSILDDSARLQFLLLMAKKPFYPPKNNTLPKGKSYK